MFDPMLDHRLTPGRIGCRTAAAMSHARREEEARKGGRAAGGAPIDGVVIAAQVPGTDDRIGEAVIQDQPTASACESRQVGIDRIDRPAERGIYAGDRPIEIEAAPVPARIAKCPEAEEARSRRLARIARIGPIACPAALAAREPGRVETFAGPRVDCALI